MKDLKIHIIFDGQCEEALAFYKECLDGEIILLQRFEDSHVPVPQHYKSKISYSEFKAGNIYFMASDIQPGRPFYAGTNVLLSLGVTDKKEQFDVFTKLSTGGRVGTPLKETPGGTTFGTITDKYGQHWMISCSG